MLATSVAAIVVLAALASSAQAVVVRLPTAGNPHGHLFGVMPRRGIRNFHGYTVAQATKNHNTGTLTYHPGGPVLHSNGTFALFWLPSGNSYTSASGSAGFESLVTGFFSDVAHDSAARSNVFSIADQYYDGTTSLFGSAYGVTDYGSLVDTQAFPTSGGCRPASAGDNGDPCVTDQQIQNEVARVIAASSAPTAGNAIDFVYLPQNVITCSDSGGAGSGNCSDSSAGGFCGYHGDFTRSGGVDTYYAVIMDTPNDCSGSNDNSHEGFPNDSQVDPTLSTTSHEHMETITDPQVASGNLAWYDDADNGEIGDLCAYTWGSSAGTVNGQSYNQTINGHHYSIQQEWSDAAIGETGGCDQSYSPASPTPTAKFSATPGSGDSFSFDGSASTGTPTSYAWDFGDGNTSSSTSASTSHTFGSAGVYTVTLTVSTGTATDVTSERVSAGPVAEFSASPQPASTSQAVSFDSSASSGAVTYSWAFGDGATSTTANPTHTYAAPGNYTVSLTITDSASHTHSTTHTVWVGAQAPSASFTPPGSTSTGVPVSFAGSASDPNSGATDSYSWNFGDGAGSTSQNPTHTYTRPGNYSVQLTVTDNYGASSTVTHSLTISHVAPSAAFTISPGSAPSGQGVTFDGSSSTDPDPGGSIQAYSWSFGDGSAGSGQTVSHTFAGSGTYTVTLVVTDNAGVTNSATHSVTITNRPPAATFTTSPSAPQMLQAVSFDGSASSDPDGSITSYAWNFGDGATAAGPSVSHTYASAGTYLVTLTVTDNSGATTTVSRNVSVASVAPQGNVAASRSTLRKLLAHGLPVTLSANQRGKARVLLLLTSATARKLHVRGKFEPSGRNRRAYVLLAQASTATAANAPVKVTLRLPRALRGGLANARSLPVKVELALTNTVGQTSVVLRQLTLR